MKVKIIDRYIYKSLILPTIFGISIFTFILMLNVLIEVMERLFTSDLPILSVVDYFFYTMPGVLVQTLPMGSFLGVMLVYGTLSDSNEIIAMEGAGIWLFRIIRPAFFFGIVLTLLGVSLEVYVNPRALVKINQQTQQILASRPNSLTEEKIFLTNNEAGFGFYIDKVNNEKAEADNFLIVNKQKNNPYPVIFLSKKAKFNPGIINMTDVKGYSFTENGDFQVSAEYKTQDIPISTFFKEGDKIKEKTRKQMNLKELNEYYLKNKNTENKEGALKARVEIYQRLIGPLASIFLCWLGVLLSVSNKRSGKGISFGVSLIVIFGYIGIANYAKIMVLNHGAPVDITMWLPNLVLFILCIYFSIKKVRGN